MTFTKRFLSTSHINNKLFSKDSSLESQYLGNFVRLGNK